jgi:hypothetical protein
MEEELSEKIKKELELSSVEVTNIKQRNFANMQHLSSDEVWQELKQCSCPR